MKVQLRKKWQNTIGHDKVQPVQLVTAEELNDLPVIIKTASEEKFKIRCAGSGHSFNDIACTHGYLVSIDKLNKIIEMPLYIKEIEKQEHKFVHVEAGITLRELNHALDDLGLSIINMGGIDHQTLAGAIATGTHGSGIELPPIHGMVRSILLAAGDGQLYRIEPSNGISDPALFNEEDITLVQNDDDFYSVLVSLGCMGIVYSYILCVEDLYWLEEKKVLDTWSAVKPKLKDKSLLKEGRHVMVLVNPYETNGDHSCLVTRINRTPKPGYVFWRDKRNFIITTLSEWRITYWIVWLSFRIFFKRTPKRIDRSMRILQDKSYIGKSYDVLFQGLQFLKEKSFDTEFVFDLEDNSFLDCIESLFVTAQRFVDQGKIYQSSPIGLRFVMPDTAYLSAGYHRAVCYVDTPVLKGTVGADELLEAYQENMFACGGFPHWGKKNFKLSGHLDKIKPRFPKLSIWQSIQKKYDPEKLFTNLYTDRFQLVK
ncbi:MAG: D-arabinono-1,4-lactone oxidase [Bacteroidota bacterium]